MYSSKAQEIHGVALAHMVEVVVEGDRELHPVALPFVAANAAVASVLKQLRAAGYPLNSATVAELIERCEANRIRVLDTGAGGTAGFN